VNPAHLPGYYETLSRGQIVTTLAELVRLGEFQTEVADQFGLSDSQREFVALTVSVVPGTAMLSVVATSEDPDLAAAMVDGVVQVATRYIGDLTLPYALVPVSTGANNLSESGQSTAVVIGVFTLAALIAGLVVQQATLQIMKLNEQRKPNRGHSVPKGPPDDARSVAEAPGSAKH
jgi:capsular polysaccharide biosynthesis protein